MPLTNVIIRPGFNKQVTSTGAESQWTGGENVRFRYGTPEKIGGWSQLGDSKLTGAARGLHHMVNKEGIKYAAIGTNRILYVYSGGVYYDIHPLVNPSGTAITSAFSTTNGQPTVTLTFSSAHNFQVGDIILFGDASTFTAITGSNFSSTTFFGALSIKSLFLRRLDIEFISFSSFSSSLTTLLSSAVRLMLAGISKENWELFTLKLADLSEKSETWVIFEIFAIFDK